MSESDVSRETLTPVEPEPEAALSVFGARVELARRYAALLARHGVERGLIGPRELPRLWTRHLLNCAVLEGGIGRGAAVADVGSGAGLPGVVLAIARPDIEVTLIEPLLRRSRFLEEVAVELGLGNVLVVRGRAEELRGAVSADVVTARAVAPLERLVRWSAPLVRPGGRLLAVKGRSAEAEVEAATRTMRRAGAVSWTVREFGRGIVEPPARAVVVEFGTTETKVARGGDGRTE